MFRGLRLRLTFLYLLVAALFTALMMLGTHWLVARYFQTTTDLALRYRMAQEFSLLGLSLPTELDSAVEAWTERQNTNIKPTQITQQPAAAHEDSEQEHEESEHTLSPANEDYERAEEAYDSNLASIYTLPLDQEGNLQAVSAPSASLIPPDAAAVQGALLHGDDLRTIELDSGTRIRLLTYSIRGEGDHPAFLQLGRLLNDQQRALNQLVIAMAGLGGGMLLVLSIGSWSLAGRSISPAEEAWSKQQAFIANAGHELRTPLTWIRANTEVLLRGTERLDPRRGKLEDILQETDHMGKLIADLLLLSRLDAHAVSLETVPVDTKQLLSDLAREMEALAAERKVTIHVDAVPGAALADPTRLRQVLIILLDNALEHTPEGGQIRFSNALTPVQIQIQVRDTGSGIPPEHLAHVFERFYQAERNGRSGSGLGLAIAKSLVNVMNGELELRSAEGEGTTAVVTLPAGG
ncbi:MAG: sensor histidine kinase [Anaerolineales bacterium]